MKTVDEGPSSAVDLRARAQAEEFVSRWFADYVETGRAKLAFPLLRPRRTAAMLRRLHRLPVLDPTPSPTGDGPAVRRALQRPFPVRLLLGGAISALAVPASSSDYLAGRSRHALRQKVRAAEQAGIRYREIDDPRERERLIRAADEYERTGAVASMRNASATNENLLPLQLWILAEDLDGVALLLAIAAVDGDVAVLFYYRTLVQSECSSLARYGAMPVVVQALSRSGVRWLTETGRPHWIHNGVRQFQRKLGFRLVRSRPRR